MGWAIADHGIKQLGGARRREPFWKDAMILKLRQACNSVRLRNQF